MNSEQKQLLSACKIRFVGRLSLFPKDLQTLFTKIQEKTAHNTKYVLNLAMGYGGRTEIEDMVKRIVEKGIPASKIDASCVAENLYFADEPDLVIRTGGACRTSNFLPWQSAYSEWFFLDKFWPQITAKDIQQVLAEFQNRKRNFGK
jgi:undecaprenyl diphosphate synthase